jgi:hypothetical protein
MSSSLARDQVPDESAALVKQEQAGWVRFAGLLMIMLGGFNILQGIVGLADENYFAVTPDGLLVVENYDTWGGFWLVVGALQIVVGLAVLGGKNWARFTAIGMLLFTAMGQMIFLAAFPIWTAVTIALVIAAMYALTVHGESFGRDEL